MTVNYKMLVGRFEVKRPPTKSGGIYLDIWMRRLIQAQGMVIVDGPRLYYNPRPGLEGWSGTAIIETSSVQLHIWDQSTPPTVHLDFFTCGNLDVQKILSAVDEWGLVKTDWWVLDREFQIVKVGGGPEWA